MAFHDPHLDRPWKPEPLKYHAEQRAKKMGYKIVNKRSWGTKMSKFTTTYYKQIRVGEGYPNYPVPIQAMIMCHEIVHARQWRHYRPARFATSYLASARFRWAMEVQGYAEGVHAAVAMGAEEDWIERNIENRAQTLRKGYSMWSLRASDVRGATRNILHERYKKAKKLVAQGRDGGGRQNR
jgi:hypothetical protein